VDLLAEVNPVRAWPTQQDKKQRTARARESVQGAAAREDRARPSPPGRQSSVETWQQRRHQVDDTTDAQRRRRREAALTGASLPPARLGASLRDAPGAACACPAGRARASPTSSFCDGGLCRNFTRLLQLFA